VSDSALRWVGWALANRGRPGLRRRSFVATQPDLGLLPQGWEEGARSEIERARRIGIVLVTPQDDGYPPLLRASSDPPPVLYVRGRIEADDRLAVAVVGARRATAHGERTAARLAEDLAGRGFTIVSGLARGVDAAAHRGALAAQGRTVAVPGCGIDQTYPPEHQSLRKEIESNGAVVAELPLGSYPHGYHFPRRNRIISGMCLGVVVTEAAIQSGSLITARLAADQGREVFAVPGFVKADNSRGPNGLIKQGAKLVETVQDIIDELLPQLDAPFRERLKGRVPHPVESPPQLGKEEATIYLALSFEPMHIDDLITNSRLPAADVAAHLLALEFKHLVRQLPGQTYLRL